ncbi:hypothetical protein ABFT23_11880 [Nocardioides sp. C4-1]|uniref:hypothetical protein n=1 Tax=Nocardioides sp. C4-1 TaxID=3151851 RepID=UPI00326367EF
MRPGHVLTGWANLHWRGGRWFTGTDAAGRELPIDVLIGTHDIRRRPGLRLSGEQVGEHLKEVVDGVAVADVRAAVAFAMRYAPSLRAAVRVLDMAAYDDLVSIAEMDEFINPGLSSWTGVPRARDALLLGSESMWSPTEADLSVVWVVVAARPRPLGNPPVFDRLTGRHVVTPDVFDPVAGVAGDYEGEVHLGRAVRAADVRREAILRDYGIEQVVMTSADRGDPTAFVRRLDQAYARAAARKLVRRRWTIDPPSWWTPTMTVAQRRALDPDQRRRLLRYRATS